MRTTSGSCCRTITEGLDGAGECKLPAEVASVSGDEHEAVGGWLGEHLRVSGVSGTAGRSDHVTRVRPAWVPLQTASSRNLRLPHAQAPHQSVADGQPDSRGLDQATASDAAVRHVP